MLIVAWNVAWAGKGWLGDRVSSVLDAFDPDVMVLTETGDHRRLFDVEGGAWVDGGAEWGYGAQRNRRKVAMWSRTGWSDFGAAAHDVEHGRLVEARTEAVGRALTVLGVCIPWRAAHVSSGRRDHAPWEDHCSFCDHLHHRIGAATHPLVVAGDFNQRIPGGRQPERARAALNAALEPLNVVTAGVDPNLLNHLVMSPDLRCGAVRLIDRAVDGRDLTDHVGVAVAVDHVDTVHPSTHNPLRPSRCWDSGRWRS